MYKTENMNSAKTIIDKSIQLKGTYDTTILLKYECRKNYYNTVWNYMIHLRRTHVAFPCDPRNNLPNSPDSGVAVDQTGVLLADLHPQTLDILRTGPAIRLKIYKINKMINSKAVILFPRSYIVRIPTATVNCSPVEYFR